MTTLPNNLSFSKNIRSLRDLISPCTLCPRNCKVYRSKSQTGFCGISDKLIVNSIGPHFGEESVLVGSGGSGTIFFSGCNLGCIFCQNFQISHYRLGEEISIEKLAQSMLDLQKQGCCNINLVTPTHLAAPLAAAIEAAKKQGLTAPIVYNTGGYDSVQTLRLFTGLIDIYMPDMKYSDETVAKQLSNAPDYPSINRQAVIEMHNQVGDLQIENGLAKCGLLVRHLVLPDNLAGSFKIIDFLAEKVSPKTTVNVMDQYHPCFKAALYPRLNRRPQPEEIDSVRRYAIEKGLRIIT